MYNQSSPMLLRSVVVLLFFCTRSERAHVDMSAVSRLAAVPATVQAALLLPSVVLPVRNRHKTTAFIAETALMMALVGAVLVAGRERLILEIEAALVLQMCTLHVFYHQTVQLQRARRLLASEAACAWVALLCSMLLPCAMVCMTPGPMPSTLSLLVFMFSGEVLGCTAAAAACVLSAVGGVYEQAFHTDEVLAD